VSPRTITGELIKAREGALTAVDGIENLLDEMGLLKSHTTAGGLHGERVLQSIQLDVDALHHPKESSE